MIKVVKKLLSVIPILIILALLLYSLFAFYFVSFNFVTWTESGRNGFCVLIGLISAIVIPVFMIPHED